MYRQPEEVQAEYYRARADEYDDFWFGRGKYELDPPLKDEWNRDAAEAEDAARRWTPTGHVLEFACGTGIWTRLLVTRDNRVTAIDSSAEMIALNRQRTIGRAVEYVRADIFSWRPPRARYDGVFMGYWHSHIPDWRLSAFWENVRSALRPGGTVMVVDTPSYPPGSAGDTSAHTATRTLNDGRQYTIIKRRWSPHDLRTYLTDRDWHAESRTTLHGLILLADATPGWRP